MDEALLGWGYEGHTSEDLVRFLLANQAATVVDVRLTPLSRKRGFAKKALGATVASAGVEYVHLRELGNPRDNRPAFARPGTTDAELAHQRFREEVLASPGGQEGLAVVRQLLLVGPVVLLCFEADPRACHRSLVAEGLALGAGLAPALVE